MFGADACWTSANSDYERDGPAGDYVCEMTFDLPLSSGYECSIGTQYGADNRIMTMMLNGLLAFQGLLKDGPCDPTGCNEFQSPTSFLINDTSLFQRGTHALKLTVRNDPGGGNPTGFIMQAHKQRCRIRLRSDWHSPAEDMLTH